MVELEQLLQNKYHFDVGWLAITWNGAGSEASNNMAQKTHLCHHTALQPGLLGIAELDPEYYEARHGYKASAGEIFSRISAQKLRQRRCHTSAACQRESCTWAVQPFRSGVM